MVRAIGSLEGSIAAGKTTLGGVLQQSPHLIFIEEPVAEWRTGFGTNLLQLFYDDMGRWGFTLQVCALVTRTQKLMAALENTQDSVAFLVSERSPLVDLYVFSALLYQAGYMSELEYRLYEALQQMFTVWHQEVQFILYLRTPASVCMERIRARNRPEEKSITHAYLQGLEDLHDAWLLNDPRAVLLNGEQWWTAEEVEARIWQKLGPG